MAKKKTTVETTAVAATEAIETANTPEVDNLTAETTEAGIEASTEVLEATPEVDIYDLDTVPTYYGYKRENKEYEGEGTPQKDPREKKWLLPGRATWVKPPEAGEHKAVRYNEESQAWELVADYRGETWYSKDTQTPHEIKEIDIDPAENDWTDVKPTDGAAKWDEESQSWKVPQEVLDERELRAAQGKANNIIDQRSRMLIAQTASFSVAEFQTLAEAHYFEEWQAGQTYEAGCRIQYEGVVYEVIQNVTAQAHQTPATEGMLAIYRPLSLDESGGEHEGTLDDPIPWIYGMDVTAGLYYSYNGKIYQAVQAQKPSVWEPGAAGTAAIWKFVQAEA